MGNINWTLKQDLAAYDHNKQYGTITVQDVVEFVDPRTKWHYFVLGAVSATFLLGCIMLTIVAILA